MKGNERTERYLRSAKTHNGIDDWSKLGEKKMKRIRIGNDVKIEWSVTEDDKPMVFAGRDVRVSLLDPSGRACNIRCDFGGDGRVVIEYSGSHQSQTGPYQLMLVSRDRDGRRLAMDAYAFELVPQSYMSGGSCDCECLTVETVDIEGDTNSGIPGFSAYEIWLQNGHEGTEDDFLDWLWREGVIRKEKDFDYDRNIQHVCIEDSEHKGRKIYAETDAESVMTTNREGKTENLVVCLGRKVEFRETTEAEIEEMLMNGSWEEGIVYFTEEES